MLLAAGYRDVGIVAGGLGAWEAAGQPLEYGPAPTATLYDGP